jgi:hypothetical protein
MFFRKKGWLRNEYDEILLRELDNLRKIRAKQKLLLEKSFDPSDEVINQVRVTEAKYFYLLKVAKNRKINFR